MKSLIGLLSAVALLAFSGCASTNYNVQQANANSLSGSKTFAWGKKTKALDNGDFFSNRSIYLDLLQKDVEEALIAKGYQKVKSGKADLTVDTALVTKPLAAQDVDAIFETKHDVVVAQTTGRGYEAGTIIVDLENAKTHQSLWRGSVTKTIDRSQPYEVQKVRIHRAVFGLIKQVPAAQ